MKLSILNKKIIFSLVCILSVISSPKLIFAVWDGSPYDPGEIDNPECLPSQTNCDVLPAVTAETDPVFTASEAFTITGTGTSNWDTAYSWGDHTGLYDLSGTANGILTTHENTYDHDLIATALQSETDPLFIASSASGITSTNISNWNTAYGWGNHASAGYLTSASLSGLVPYTGATSAIDLGAHNFTVDTNTLFVDSTNHKLGVGTIVPNYTLTIKQPSNSTSTGLQITQADSASSGMVMQFISNDAIIKNRITGGLALGTNDVTRLYINSSGNVGIGTTSPGYALDVSGEIRTTSNLQLTGVSGVGIKYYTSAITFSSGGSITYNSANNIGHYFNGSVGIGTTSPVYPLQINGTQGNGWVAGFQSTDSVYNGRVLLGSRAAGAGSIQGATNTGAVGPLIINPDGGNVGIGTNNPVYKLDVNGTLHTLGSMTVQNGNIALNGANTGITHSQGAKLQLVGDGPTYPPELRFFSNSGEKFTVKSTGNVGIGINVPTAYLNIKAGTATAETAPLKFTSGTNLTTPEEGAIEFDGTNLYFTDSTPTRQTLITNSSLATSLGSYIPYTGATGVVTLGANTLSTTSGLITPKIYPSADSTTAFQINKADGTTNVFNVDTTNGYIGIGTIYPTYKLEIIGSGIADMISTNTGLNFTTVADPSFPSANLELTAGGTNLGIGTYKYTLRYKTAFGYTGTVNLGGGSAAIITDASNRKVAITLPVSTDPRVIGRTLYRTKVGSSIPIYRLVEINDNTTTTYVDDIADTSLTVLGNYYGMPNYTTGGIAINGASLLNVDLTGGSLALGRGAGNAPASMTAASTFVGYYAGVSSTTASSSSVFGYRALPSNTTGQNNSVFGTTAMYVNISGQNNSAFGVNALYNSTGSGSSAFGMYSLQSQTSGTNTAFGGLSMMSTTTGTGNIGIGYSTGRYIADGSTPNTTNNYSIYIGDNVRALSSGDTNEIIIGNATIGNGSNSVTLGNDSITKTILKGNVGINTVSPSTNLEIGSSDLGDGVAGPIITLGRNTNATNTGAGSINLLDKAGTNGYVWQDAAGNLRINTSAPSNANDTAGVVVGAQTSERATKQDITDYTDYNNALSMIVNAPLHTFRYIKEVNGYGTDSPLAKTRIGYIADEVDPIFMVGNVIDQVSVNGLLMASVKELNLKLESIATPIDETKEQTFTERFFAKLIIWFGSSDNGLERICVKKSDGTEFCVNGDQLEKAVNDLSDTSITPTTTTSSPTSTSSTTDATSTTTTGTTGDTTTGATTAVGDGSTDTTTTNTTDTGSNSSAASGTTNNGTTSDSSSSSTTTTVTSDQTTP